MVEPENDYLHQWAAIVQEIRVIKIRDKLISLMLKKNEKTYQAIEEKMNSLLEKHKDKTCSHE